MGKLQEQMKADLLLKRYSPHTTRAYLRCIRNFAKHFMRPPSEMGETEVRQFLLHLTQDRKVSAFVQDMHVGAQVSIPDHPAPARRSLNTSLTPKDPKPFPKSSPCRKSSPSLRPFNPPKYKAILATAYGAGLRISEVCALKPTDIDSQRMLIHVRLGKGNKDRYVLLGETSVSLAARILQNRSPERRSTCFPDRSPRALSVLLRPSGRS